MTPSLKPITPETQKQRIRMAFEAGRRMTSHEANKVGRTVDARKYISDLRASGLDIQDTWEKGDDGRTYSAISSARPPLLKSAKMKTHNNYDNDKNNDYCG